MLIKRNTEIWKDIKGFPGYQISNFGKVKSLDRCVNSSDNKVHFYKERILKPGNTGNVYLKVDLSISGQSISKTIHLLVIHHFGPPKPSPKHECNHKDGIKINNWWTNLEWMTSKENTNHAFSIGLINDRTGENNGFCKLTKKEVKKIRKLYATKRYSQSELGKMFNVTQANISAIIIYKLWK